MLQNNENEQIKHNVGTDHDKHEEENWSITNSTTLSGITVSIISHAIKHNQRPVFPCRYSEQYDHRVSKVPKVHIRIDYTSILNVLEQIITQYCKNEENKNQKC